LYFDDVLPPAFGVIQQARGKFYCVH